MTVVLGHRLTLTRRCISKLTPRPCVATESTDEARWVYRPRGRPRGALGSGRWANYDMSSIPINYYPFSIRASHNDGVQTLTLPVSERTRPRRIQVRRGGEGQPRVGEEPA